MANTQVTLIWRCKTEKGWRQFQAVYGTNGRPKKGVVMVGKPAEGRYYPEGRFQLRYYEGDKMAYKDIGEDAKKALDQKHVMENLLKTRTHAAAAGVQIVEDPERRSLKKAYAAFLEAAEDRGSKEAKIVYKTAGDDFFKVVSKTYVDELVVEDMLKYLRHLRQKRDDRNQPKYRDRTIFNRWANIKAFFLYCGVDPKKMRSEDGENRRLAAPKYEEKIPEIYEPEEIKKLFPAIAGNDRLYAACKIMLKCGLRDQEMQFLERKNVSLTQGLLFVRGNPHYDFKVKDHEQRDIPIPKDLVAWLQKYFTAHPNDRLVCPTSGGEPNTKLLRTLKRAVRPFNCNACAGCAGKEQECRRWFLHKFRATCITLWLRPVSMGGAGLDLRTVMRLSGHATLDSVMRYLSPASNEFVRDSVNAITYGD